FNMRGTVTVRCAAGDVNTGSGARADVLQINGTTGGTTRSVSIGLNQPVTATLAAAPGGPNPGAYVLYAWRNATAHETRLLAGGSPPGCVENPTPDTGGTPQPFRCLMGTTAIAATCGIVTRFHSPPSVPWTVSRPSGTSHAASFVLQGVIQDSGSAV